MASTKSYFNSFRPMKTKLIIGLSLLATLSIGQLQAESLTLDAATYVGIRSGLENQDSDNNILVGQTTGSTLRGLLSFDFSSTGIDFSKVTIDKITVNLTFSRNDPGSKGTDLTLDLHELTQPFSLKEVTWLQAADGENWAAGGPHNPTILASAQANPTTVIAESTLSFSGSALDALITNALINNTTTNLLVKLNTEDRSAREIFYFGRGKPEGQPIIHPAMPSITIEYSTIPEAGDVAMIAGGAAALSVLLLRKRLRRRD